MGTSMVAPVVPIIAMLARLWSQPNAPYSILTSLQNG